MPFGWRALGREIRSWVSEELRDAAILGSASDLGGLPQRHRIHAITQAAGSRAIRKDVAEVGVTGVANGLDALQERRSVKPVSNDITLNGLCKRRPSGAGFEFLCGIEKDRVAAKAGIDPRLKEAAHFRAEGPLRSGLPGDVVFLVT